MALPSPRPTAPDIGVDCVVMLTGSDWHREARGNRYHFATRWAQHLPVFFVSFTGGLGAGEVEDLGPGMPTLVGCAYPESAPDSLDPVRRVLAERGMHRPLLWLYHSSYSAVWAQMWGAPVRLVHATEYVLSPPPWHGFDEHYRQLTVDALAQADAVIAVSDTVAASVEPHVRGVLRTVSNGCDVHTWGDGPVRDAHGAPRHGRRPVAVYQGGVNVRVDFDLLAALATRMPEWDFELIGRTGGVDAQLEELRRHRNVTLRGELRQPELRDAVAAADVGLIPFVPTEAIAGSLPLKAYEYVAAGLPVVTVPIRALDDARLFTTATTVDEWVEAIERAGAMPRDAETMAMRRTAAAAVDYDAKFEQVHALVHSMLRERHERAAQLRWLVLYDDRSVHVQTVSEHLSAFASCSRGQVFYVVGTNGAPQVVNPDDFDIVITHYSVRMSLDWHLSPAWVQPLADTTAFKVAMIQDEYDNVHQARTWLSRLRFDALFTCVPAASVDVVYPPTRLPGLVRMQNLTGYVPESLERLPRRPIAGRELVIAYRGRPLPHFYGDLAREKWEIGMKMRAVCEERGIPSDIAWDHESRVYGPQWYDFLASAKATLATESGSNVFDWHGTLHPLVADALLADPDLSYEEIHARFLAEYEGQVIMNQVSPKVFEAVALGTVLVLYEGRYSDVLIPGRHYIELKKDWSNIDDVLLQLADDEHLQSMADAAYEHLIESGTFSYRSFIEQVEAALGRLVPLRATRWDARRAVELRTITPSTPGALPVPEPDAIDHAPVPEVAPASVAKSVANEAGVPPVELGRLTPRQVAVAAHLRLVRGLEQRSPGVLRQLVRLTPREVAVAANLRLVRGLEQRSPGVLRQLVRAKRAVRALRFWLLSGRG